jgi:phosphoglycerol transferase
VVSLAAAVVLLRLRHVNLRAPFEYAGDVVFYSAIVKAIVEQGWYLTITRAGAPGVLQLHDFPMFDLVHNLAFRVMGLFSHDWALLLNLYFLAGFALIAMSALAVLRHFRISYAPALAASVLYAFLPSRLLKGEGHLQLDNFFQVPLAVLVALWLCGDAPPLVRDRGPGRWPGLDLRGRRSVVAIAVCLLTAGTGLYYAFFAGALFALGGAWASLRRRTPRHALAGLMLSGIMAAGLAAQALPTVIYQHRNGANIEIARRGAGEAEFYGLKITQLLLPSGSHRVPALSRLKERYQAGTLPKGGEVEYTTLGFVGAVGFVWLLAIGLLGAQPRRARDDLLYPLAVLNLLAVLIGTLGGFGSLFAFLITPEIRTYCRIAVIIAFFSLFASALLIERLGAGRAWRTGAMAAMALYLGLYDQVSRQAVRPYASTEAAYNADRQLVSRIEAIVPAGGMIFQLPFLRFPESGAPPGMLEYDQLRFYLHSRSLRWSYPTIANRAGDAWASHVAGQEPATMIQTLSDTDFAGIVVDRNGYPDQGANLEAGLQRVLGPARLVSDDRRYVFFDLAAYSRAARASLSVEDRERRRQAATHTVYLRWSDGFFGEEKDANGLFHWSSGRAWLEINNSWDSARAVELTTTFAAAQPPLQLRIDSPLLTERIEVPPQGAPLTRTLTVPPGRNLIRVRGDGRPAIAPGDPRTMIWRMNNTAIKDLAAPDAGPR